MTALSDNVIDLQRSDGDIVSYLVEGGKKIYKGALVVKNAAGYLEPLTDAVAKVFAGVADEGADATDLADGAIRCRVHKTGVFPFTKNIPIIDDVADAYLEGMDDATVGGTGDATNHIKVGAPVGLYSTTGLLVRIDGFAI